MPWMAHRIIISTNLLTFVIRRIPKYFGHITQGKKDNWKNRSSKEMQKKLIIEDAFQNGERAKLKKSREHPFKQTYEQLHREIGGEMLQIQKYGMENMRQQYFSMK